MLIEHHLTLIWPLDLPLPGVDLVTSKTWNDGLGDAGTARIAKAFDKNNQDPNNDPAPSFIHWDARKSSITHEPYTS
jgi:hypothetical protein